MISPADQPPFHEAPRSSDPPTLWLSLVLGSVLIHLVLFILATLFLTRTATVQLDPEPIAVELVDPNAVTAQSTAPSQAIAARPGAPSASQPSATQAQPNDARSQPSEVNPAVEQPFVQPTLQRRLPTRRQPPQPQLYRNPVLPSNPPIPQPSEPANNSTQPPPNSTSNPFPQASVAPDPGQTQPPSGLPQEGLPGAPPNPSATSVPPSATGERIPQGPSGDSIIVTVSNPRQAAVDVQLQAAQPIETQKNVTVRYSPVLAQQTIRLEATLTIDQKGQVLRVEKTTLLSSSTGSVIDEATLNELATQIFTQWRFQPAQNNSNGKVSIPPLSNLMIEAQVQLP